MRADGSISIRRLGPAWPGTVEISKDGAGIDLQGPIAQLSGTAEAILMAYAEGLPPDQLGWGRVVGSAQLLALSQWHALLFDIYARPDYMAQHTAAMLSRELIDRLQAAHGPKISLFVGSDNHILALAALLGVHFRLPGYALDDPPIGGAMVWQVWRDTRSGRRWVRMIYQAQSLNDLRQLSATAGHALPLQQELIPGGCQLTAKPSCPLPRVLSRLQEAAALVD